MSLFDDAPNTLTSSVRVDDTVRQLAAAFDYPFDGNSTFTPPTLRYPKHFTIGLIVGPSGSGKSTLLREFGEEAQPQWDTDRAVCSHFASADDARDRLGAVGFNSIPSWMRPYHVLSTGEKFRADTARRLCDGAVVDEFTSVVDRNVAKSCANSIRRYVDQKGLTGLVFASCHYDIIEWLRPDWVFDTSSGMLTARGLERRPPIVLEMLPCSPEAWSMFRNHHYLDGNINKASHCWICTWNGTPVGFSSALPFPNGNFKRAWRGHRTVVLPDYQGLGIGVRISDVTGEMFLRNGYRYFSKTAHPRMGEYRNHSPLWKPTSKNGINRQDYKSKTLSSIEGAYQLRHADRTCYSHEYVGGMKYDQA
jgi:energy-coupling factor transporter ATP-binding protein EcfA2